MTLVLLNGGEAAEFVLTVNTVVMGSNTSDFFQYTLTPSTVFVANSSTVEIVILINVSSNITDGLAVTFTVVAESDLDNDFVTFSMVTTTKLPPEFTDNVRQLTKCGMSIELLILGTPGPKKYPL